MTPTYDPKRSRPRPPVAPAEESAPIDGLLGPELAPVVPSDAAATTPSTSSTSSTSASLVPVAKPSSRRGGPAVLMQLAPLVVLGALVAFVVWLWSRRRSH